ncbi:MAG: UDP-glucose 4-epimerase, partial [Clostridiales bacterium]|nr:UDP-glucose 4-epimerase [Clostridiales bacterium]
MRILVTGGTGYIGSHTCIELLNAGYEVLIIDNLSNSKHEVVDKIKKISNKNVVFYEADIRDNKKLYEIFEGNTIEAVIHFAGLKAVGESVKKPIEYYENNVTGTLTLLKAMQIHNIKKMVFSSSATVYGMTEKMPVTEEADLSAVNPYGRTKLMIEE